LLRFTTTLVRESLAHELAKLSGQPAKSIVEPVASSEAVSKLLMKVQEDNYLDVDKLNAKLRKEFDAAKAANKAKMKELQRVTAELSHVERMVQSDRAEGGAMSRDKGVQELEGKIEAVQQQCQVRAPLLCYFRRIALATISSFEMFFPAGCAAPVFDV
jgi:predicted phage gp36 major capsid-like protein